MNFFEFYKIPITFLPDEAELRKTFYAYSKEYHPDFYTLADEEKQLEVLELSTFNNDAYKTLSDFDKRMRYILEIKEVLEEEGKNQIPQDFLMEMMDINEVLMELEFDFDSEKLKGVKGELKTQEDQLLQSIQPLLDSYDDEKVSAESLEKIKGYYFKKRYLLRISSNLVKFDS